MNGQLFLCPKCQCHLLASGGRAPDTCVHCGHRWGQDEASGASTTVGRSARGLMLGLLVGGSVMASGLSACDGGDEVEGTPTAVGTPAVTDSPETTGTPAVAGTPVY